MLTLLLLLACGVPDDPTPQPVPPAPSVPAVAIIDPVAPPSPAPANTLDLPPGRAELLAVTGYSGKTAPRWRTSSPAVLVVGLKAKTAVRFTGPTPPVRETVAGGGPTTELVHALKAGASAPSQHVIGADPAVLVLPVGSGEATVEADGTDADGNIVTLLSVRVRCGTGPQPPPPGPTPPTPPGPTPPQPPAPAAPVAFLVVVEETADAVANRGAFFADAALSQRMKARGLRWRVVDKDVVGADGKPPADVARFLAAAAGKSYPSLFLVDAAGKLIDQRPVPRTPADLLTLLAQFGG